jgi:hypothetical protein
MNWDARHVALGLAQRPDLCREVSAYQDPVRDKHEIDAVVEIAREIGMGHLAARQGTCVHAFSAPYADTDDIPLTNDPIGDVEVIALRDAVRKTLADHRLHALPQTEIFVGSEQFRVAGSIDMLVQFPSGFVIDGEEVGGKVIIGDIKTGKHAKPLAWCIQLTAYAYGQRYFHDANAKPEDRWTPVHPGLDPRWAVVIAPRISSKPILLKTSPGLLGLACTAHRCASMTGAKEAGCVIEFPTDKLTQQSIATEGTM